MNKIEILDQEKLKSKVLLNNISNCLNNINYKIDELLKFKDQQEKAVLRDAFKDFLPQEIYNRKKNPYPKTHSPFFLTYIKNLLLETLNDKNNILYQLFDIKKLDKCPTCKLSAVGSVPI